MLCKGCSAGVLNHPFYKSRVLFLMFQWACVWHDVKLVFRFTWQAGKTFVTTFWQLLQHFEPIPNYPVYSILTIPCKNINLLWLFFLFPPLLKCLGEMRLTANQNACNASDIHVFLLAENVWGTKPLVMDLNLFDSFLLTLFEWTSSILLFCTVVITNPL